MSDVRLPGAEARIGVDASGVRRGVNQANSAFAILEKTVATNWWGLRNLGLAFAALPAVVGAGLVASIRATMAWEDAMAGVERTTYDGVRAGETLAQANERNAKQLGELEQQLLDIAKVKPLPTVEILGIAEGAGALGVAREDIVDFTNATADLAATTDLTSDAAATALARIAGLTGLTGKAYDNLASAILEAGRSTAATESEIVSTASRLAGVASVVGLTADQVVGISAALQSVGIKSQAGGTAIQRTFIDIMQAITDNGEQVRIWASLTGQSVGDFAASFKADAAGTLARITEGLGGLAAQGVDTTAVLANLEITEARQIQALLSLAAGQNSATGSGFRLTEILDDSRKAMEEGTTVADIAGRRYKTLSSGIQILKNNLFALGVTIGKDVVPYIRPLLDFVLDLVRGFGALPGPVRGAISVFVGFLAIVSGLAAVALLVVPRMVLMAGAMRNLQAAAGAGIKTVDGHTGALNRNTVAATKNAAANKTAAAAMATNKFPAGVLVGPVAPVLTSRGNINTGATEAKRAAQARKNAAALDIEAKAAREAAKATDSIGPAAARSTKWVGRLGRAGGALAGIFALATIGLSTFGNKLGDNQAEFDRLTAKNNELVKSIREQSKGLNTAADDWIRLQLAQRGADKTANALGISQEMLMNVIKGNASQDEIDKFFGLFKQLEESDQAIQGTEKLRKNVQELFLIFKNSNEEAGSIVRANGAITQSDEDLAAAFEETSEKAKEKQTALEDQARAHIDYIQSMFSVRAAEDGVRNALEQYNEAQRKATESSEDFAAAQRQIDDAVRDVASAEREAAQALIDLQRSRQRGIDELADSEDSLADARDSYLNGLDDIKEKEEEIAELRTGPAADTLREALSKLRDANLDLVRSTQKVEDAEWQVQYLREEGASQRDISDAEFAIVEARDEVLDATDSLVEAEDEIADLRDFAARNKAIQDAERELEALRRNSAGTLRDIAQKEQEVNDLRAKVAADGFYRDALIEYESAQYRVRDSVLAVKQAEAELADLRRANQAQKDVREAAEGVEAALYAQAEAATEARIQQKRMAGQTVTASEEAHILAEELSKLVNLAPTSQARSRLLDYIDILRRVPRDLPPVKIPPLPPLPRFPPGSGPVMPPLEPPKESWTDQVLRGLKGGANGALAGGAIGSIFGPLGVLAGATIGQSIGQGITNWSQGKDIKESATNVLLGFLLPFTNFSIFDGVQETFRRFIRNVREFFGIESPSKVMAAIGTDVILGFIRGVLSSPEEVRKAAGELRRWVTEEVADAGSWLWGTGYNVVIGLINGMGSLAGRVSERAWEIKDIIWRNFANAGNLLWDAGYSIIRGLWNGVVSAYDRLFKPMWNQFIDWLPGSALDAWKIGSPSRLFHDAGYDIILGLARGLEKTGPVVSAMDALHEATKLDVRSLQDMAMATTGMDVTGLAKQSAATAANSVISQGNVTNNWILDQTVNEGAGAEEIVGEFMWATRVRTR